MLAARSAEKLEALAEELGGPEHALAVPCDVTDWDEQQRMVQSALDAYEGARRRVRQRRLRRRARLPEGHARALAGDGAHERLRRGADDPRDDPGADRLQGHLLLTSSVAGRRVLPGSFYSVTKHAVTAMGEAARQDLHGTGIRVTLIEPGMVDTPFFENKPTDALQDEDIARAVMFALAQPPHVDVNEILVRPTAQAG